MIRDTPRVVHLKIGFRETTKAAKSEQSFNCIPKQFPPTNNQLRSSSNSRTHATVHDGQIVTETVQRRAPGNVGNTGSRGNQSYCNVDYCDRQREDDIFTLMEAERKDDVLDASKAEAFLADVGIATAPYDPPQALTTTNMFQANQMIVGG
ncbi:hypothetical protein Tco_0978778 [Tanacetum coccineum]|uniref:Uncharacterized protein n=1 Tax=Tanacetum coccineum TaxID=301880 RepID=A0ABQ5ENW7_9ASTR